MPSHDNTIRVQSSILKLTGFLNTKIISITGIKIQYLNSLYQKAILHNFEPCKDAKLLDVYVQDAPHSG
jgi:hypothetical protein